MLITRILQLLVIGIQATAEDDIDGMNFEKLIWAANILSLETNLTRYFLENRNRFDNPEQELPESIKNQLEPAFKLCKNDIEPVAMTLAPKDSLLSDDFIVSKRLIDEIIKGEGSGFVMQRSNIYWTMIGRIVSCNEILRNLLANRAIPSVKTGEKNTGVSLSMMNNWLFYSLELLIDKTELKTSKGIKKFKKIINDLGNRLDSLLTDLKDPTIDKKKIYEDIDKITKVVAKNQEFKDVLTDTISKIKLNSNDANIQERRYWHVNCLLNLVQNMVSFIVRYASVCVIEKERIYQKDFDIFIGLLDSYENLTIYLFIFSIPFDRAKLLNQVLDGVVNTPVESTSHTFKPFDFTILGEFNIFSDNNDYKKEDFTNFVLKLNSSSKLDTPKSPAPAITNPLDPGNTTPSTTTKTDDGWGIGTIILMIGIVLLILAVGMTGIYYLTRESKPASEV